jgi:hypothetical protein
LHFYKGSLRLYIVDNSPDDSAREQLSAGDCDVYIHRPDNPGFGRAHNLAIRQAQIDGSDYHLVVNADVRFTSDVLAPMLAYMEEHPEVGQMMPLVHYPDGRVQRLCKLVPTPADLFLRRFSSSNRREASNRRFELHDSGYNKIMFVPYLSGCFMLLRQSALQTVGLFDERFFMYPEDIDLTRRVAERYETLFFPNVCIVHEHGAASRRSLRMMIIHVANLFRYFNKWGWVCDPIRDRLNQKTLSQF